jgi:hypothetical protein
MNTLVLTLADFTKALPFSNKIEDRQIQPFVAECLLLDLVPLLGYELLELVNQLTVPELTPFVSGDPRVANTYYLYRERVYCATADVAAPAQDDDSLVYEPLLTLWTQYLKPYWIRKSFARFLPQHGQDFTKAGVTTPTDPQGTFRPISATDKANLQAAHDTAAEAFRSRLTAFMSTEKQAYNPDKGTGYNYALEACHAPTSHRTRIRGINLARHAHKRH